MSIAWLLLSLLAPIQVPAIWQGQVKLDLKDGNKVSGWLTCSLQLGANGELTKLMTISPKDGSSALTFREIRSKTGEPKRESFLFLNGGAFSTGVEVDFGPQLMTISTMSNGKRRSNTGKIPPGTILKAPSGFWFVRDHPNPGTTVSFDQFDMISMKWKRVRETYIGEETLTIKNRQVKAHKIQTTENVQWVDAHGLPYRLEYTLEYTLPHKSTFERE